MRGIPLRFWGLSVVLVVLNLSAWYWVQQSAGRPLSATQQVLKVVSTLPQKQVDETDRLSIVFDGPAVEPSKIGQLEDAPLFKVSPDIPGQWQWASAERLDYVLEDPLPAGRTINIQPSSDLEVRLGRAVQISAEIEFQTRALELNQCNILSSNRQEVQFELIFNQPVDPGALLRHLKVQESLPLAAAPDLQAAQPAAPEAPFNNLHPTCLTAKPNTRLVLRCNRPERRSLDVILAAELTGHEADRSIGKVTTRNLTLNHTFAYLRNEVPTPGTEQQLTARLYFSEDLEHTQKLPPITIEPPVTGIMPIMDLSSVDLPMPLWPRIPTISPWATLRSMPRNTGIRP